MNLAELHKKLIAVARANPPSDRVPFAFEKRITALLMSCPAVDHVAIWARALWRGAVSCLVVVLVVVAFSMFAPHQKNNSSLAQDFENTMLASADQDSDSFSW
jgi:hypothetical protein